MEDDLVSDQVPDDVFLDSELLKFKVKALDVFASLDGYLLVLKLLIYKERVF